MSEEITRAEPQREWTRAEIEEWCDAHGKPRAMFLEPMPPENPEEDPFSRIRGEDETAPQGRVQFHTIDTTPGSGSVFAPPAGYNPEPEDYRGMMRGRYAKSNFRQDMMIVARRTKSTENCPAVRVVGPYAAEVWEILRMISAGNKASK